MARLYQITSCRATIKVAYIGITSQDIDKRLDTFIRSRGFTPEIQEWKYCEKKYLSINLVWEGDNLREACYQQSMLHNQLLGDGYIVYSGRKGIDKIDVHDQFYHVRIKERAWYADMIRQFKGE